MKAFFIYSVILLISSFCVVLLLFVTYYTNSTLYYKKEYKKRLIQRMIELIQEYAERNIYIGFCLAYNLSKRQLVLDYLDIAPLKMQKIAYHKYLYESLLQTLPKLKKFKPEDSIIENQSNYWFPPTSENVLLRIRILENILEGLY